MHKRRCLKCQKVLPLQTALNGSDSTAHDGDIAICFECGETMIFQGVSFRYPTPEEFQELMHDEDFSQAMAMVAVKVSGAKDPAAVIITDSGVATVLATGPETICEMCGKLEETRHYGPRKPDGARMIVCFPCANKNEEEAMRAFNERIEGRNPV